MSVSFKADAIVVGSGVAGGTIARELAAAGKKVIVIEKGPKLKKIAAKELVIDDGSGERTIETMGERLGILLDVKYADQPANMPSDRVYFYRSLVVGGTSITTAANAIRSCQKELQDLGVDLEEQFTEAERELRVATGPMELMGDATRTINRAAEDLGYEMRPMPKFVDFGLCKGCGRCTSGCPTKAKWTSLEFLEEAMGNGAKVEANITVEEVITKGGEAVGVKGHNAKGDMEFYGDITILCAGAFSTPVILQASGIDDAGKSLSVDFCRNTCGIIDSLGRTREQPTPTICDDMYKERGFYITPVSYLDARGFVIGITTKTKDGLSGTVHPDGSISKQMTTEDVRKLNEGSDLGRQILLKAGARPDTIFDGEVLGPHPACTAPLGSVVDKNFEAIKMKNLFVCDASIFPTAPGAPPVLTIVALSKYFSKMMACRT